MKRLMKFFNSGTSDLDYENSNFEGLDKDSVNPNYDESEIINTTLEDVNSEYFEQPKRKKGRPRKLKALTESEEIIPAGTTII